MTYDGVLLWAAVYIIMWLKEDTSLQKILLMCKQ